MTTIEEALNFVRNSNHDDWNVLITEMNLTSKRRNQAAARSSRSATGKRLNRLTRRMRSRDAS